MGYRFVGYAPACTTPVLPVCGFDAGGWQAIPTLEHTWFPFMIVQARQGCGKIGAAEAARATIIESMMMDYHARIMALQKNEMNGWH